MGTDSAGGCSTRLSRSSSCILWLQRFRQLLTTVLILTSGCSASVPDGAESRSAPTVAKSELHREFQGSEVETTNTHDSATSLFQNRADELGIHFEHRSGLNGRFLMPEIMGAGVGILDFDCDGLLDVYLINGGNEASVIPHASGQNRLFRQRNDGRFEDVTDATGAGDEHFGMGVAIADVNNDGFPDFYLTNYGEDQLYINDRGKRFVNVTTEAGLKNVRWSVSAAFADINRDGWLDLYVANYVDYDPSRACPTADGRPDYCSPQQFPGTTDVLFLNTATLIERDGLRIPVFRDCSLESGIAGARGAGLGVGLIDANQDGWIDFYVANDMTANFLWINQRDGTFRDDAVSAGVALDGIGNGQASMGIAIEDFDQNGLEDIFLTHLTGETNTLYLQVKSGIFDVASHTSGLARASFAETGFGVAAFDLENDGDLDLAVVNGKVTLATESFELPTSANSLLPYAQQNQLFVQESPGVFGQVAGDSFSRGRWTTRGLAMGDINGDGAIDLLISNAAGPAEMWINQAPGQGDWLQLQLTLPEFGNRAATGAVAEIVCGDRRWRRRLTSSGSYASAHAEVLHFGLGRMQKPEFVIVYWPDGSVERYPAAEYRIQLNRQVRLEQGTGLSWTGIEQ